MKGRLGWLVAMVLVASPTWAMVLCEKKSGALFVRTACKKKETLVNPVALGLQGPPGAKGDMGPPGNPGPGITELSAGVATSLSPHTCYALLVDGAASTSSAGNILTAWLQSAGGQAVVDNIIVMVPGTRDLTTQGGSVGSVLICNPSDNAENLPTGWMVGLKEVTVP